MPTMAKSCVICGSDESEDEVLVAAPCGRHFVCADDIASFFENATNSESLFPPKCCGQMFMLQDYENHLPFEMSWAYQVKEQGEYAILAKFRVYCASPPCAKFLHPTSHIEDPETKITYAICEAEDCGTSTCVKCKTYINDGTQNHKCAIDDDDKKFKQTATEKGYQECFVCGATVELAEACNHITCECGNSFCYICGESWNGLHGCPHYGPAVYDEEGYNQDGFHRATGLNRDGLTRRQHMIQTGDDDDDEDEGEDEDQDDEDEQDEDHPHWDVLQHLTREQLVMITGLPIEAQEDALDQFRIELFENQGILFNQGQHLPHPPPPVAHENPDSGNEEEVESPRPAGDGNEEVSDSSAEEDDDDDPDEGHALHDGDHGHRERYADDQSQDEDQSDLEALLDNATQAAINEAATAAPASLPAPSSTTHDGDADSDTDEGAYTVIARNFNPGTTGSDVVALVENLGYGEELVGRTIIAAEPLVVELFYVTKEAAMEVVDAFHGEFLAGMVLGFRLKEYGVEGGEEEEGQRRGVPGAWVDG